MIYANFCVGGGDGVSHDSLTNYMFLSLGWGIVLVLMMLLLLFGSFVAISSLCDNRCVGVTVVVWTSRFGLGLDLVGCLRWSRQ
jgi:hypothetical protein